MFKIGDIVKRSEDLKSAIWLDWKPPGDEFIIPDIVASGGLKFQGSGAAVFMFSKFEKVIDMKIEIGGNYRVNGTRVEIIKTDAEPYVYQCTVVGIIHSDPCEIIIFRKDGYCPALRIYLEEVNLKVDDKILVRDDEYEEWVKQHFARYEGDGVLCYPNSTTSWSHNNPCVLTPWNQWRLP